MRKILLVDDEESVRFSISEYFAVYGYKVDCAQERSEAEALLASNDYSVVIQDLCLDGVNKKDGFDIVEHIRRQYPKTRVIVLTAYGTPEVEKESMNRGAAAFLRKPKPLADVAQVVYGMMPANA